MRRSWWSWTLQLALVATVAWFVGQALVRHWAEFRSYQLDLSAHPGLIVAALLCIWLGYAVLIMAWRGVVVGWGESMDHLVAARIWALSSLGKYIPGKLWAVAGMVVLAQRAGVRPLTATGSAVVMQILALGTGSAVVAATGAASLAELGPGFRIGLLVLLLASLGGTALLLEPKWLGRVLDHLPLSRPRSGPGSGAGARSTAGGSMGAGASGAPGTVSPTAPSIVAGAIGNAGAWIAYGVAVWLLARALVPGTPFPLAATIGAFTASYVIGFLALFVPGGLGVREGVFILMLQGSTGLAAATVMALASRLLFTLAEVGVAVPFLIFPRGVSRAAS